MKLSADSDGKPTKSIAEKIHNQLDGIGSKQEKLAEVLYESLASPKDDIDYERTGAGRGTKDYNHSIRPPKFNYNLAQQLLQLSKICPLSEAIVLLKSEINGRLSKGGTTGKDRNKPYILKGDVLNVLHLLKQRLPSPDSRSLAEHTESFEVATLPCDSQSDEDMDKGDDGDEEVEGIEEDDGGLETQETQQAQETCGCPVGLVSQIPRSGVKLGDQQGLVLVGQVLDVDLQANCRRLGLHNNKSRRTISRRMGLVYEHRSRLKKLQVRKVKWFRLSPSGTAGPARRVPACARDEGSI
ncbi:MAG: hypothetical protein M1840_005277 [Geoglossum simile]|nr:MAG: hypothetical protein M1840_005277 [Geoglossum simile]